MNKRGYCHKKMGSMILFMVSMAAYLCTWELGVLTPIGGVCIWLLSLFASFLFLSDSMAKKEGDSSG
ncbi:hypothetical protein D3C73_531580 [compost metagenome]